MDVNITWRRSYQVGEFSHLLHLVEPNIFDERNLTSRFPKYYRAYVATRSRSPAIPSEENENKYVSNSNSNIIAFAIAAWLPRQKVLHIEDFALCPLVRQQGIARLAFTSWQEFLNTEWPETGVETSKRSLMIEVYYQNIEAWRKIMQVEILDVQGIKPFGLKISTPIMVMGSRIQSPVLAYLEWQNFQRMWIKSMKMQKSLNIINTSLSHKLLSRL